MPNAQILRDMALFVEVARNKSFTKAAETLGMPISSLSRRITLFEHTVGMRLIDRTTRKLVLTACGESYLQEAMRIVEDAHRTFDELVAQARGPSGSLRIAMPPEPWLAAHLSVLVEGFMEAHPEISVHIEPRMADGDMTGDVCDLALVVGAPRGPSLISRKVTEIEAGLFAAPSYLAKHPAPVTPEDLSSHTAIHAAAGATAEWLLTNAGETMAVQVAGSVSCAGHGFGRHLALAGLGVAAANVASVEHDLRDGALERILPEWRLPPVPVHIVTTSRLVPAKARAFIDFATRRLASSLIEAARANPGKRPPLRVLEGRTAAS